LPRAQSKGLPRAQSKGLPRAKSRCLPRAQSKGLYRAQSRCLPRAQSKGEARPGMASLRLQALPGNLYSSDLRGPDHASAGMSALGQEDGHMGKAKCVAVYFSCLIAYRELRFGSTWAISRLAGRSRDRLPSVFTCPTHGKGRSTMTATSSDTPQEIVPLDMSKIDVSDLNVRKHGADQDLDDLADSIRVVGLVQPVVVMRQPGKDRYQLIVGQRRFLAHKKLREKTIPAIVIDPLSEEDALIRSLVENVHRVDLNHADAARAATELYKRLDKNVKAVSKATGLSPRRVRQYVKIEALASDKIRCKLNDKKVAPRDVQRALEAAHGNIGKAEDLLDLMEKYKMDKHQKARLVEIGEASTGASAKTIFKEALKPRIEESVTVPLPTKLRNGLAHAAKKLEMTWEEVAAEALEYWLQKNGYLE